MHTYNENHDLVKWDEKCDLKPRGGFNKIVNYELKMND